ncbi:transcriptional regulator BetI [Curvivirga aplysinae]|uniref:transcriptional regulator BetI n=1 Tax=Curvivirga aplysinae TaxID=2529852 RepID=UPI0012BCCA38|nr:transcriptional regulator BetI [Curvivirga aplysinae]MTI08739.1 transcriptional regulator BetI [Curvivirga aplysinae]
MGRKNIAKIRRSELAITAYQTLTKYGIQGTTLHRVAEEAGISKAGILHYYKNKDELLEAAMREANSVVRKEVVCLFNVAQNPWERIYAIVQANFSHTSFKPEVAHSWINLCAEVPFNMQFQRIQAVIYRRMYSNLYSALKQITTTAHAKQITMTLTTAIDGLWLRCGLQLGGIDRETALAEIEFLLTAILPQSSDQLLARDKMIEAANMLQNLRT